MLRVYSRLALNRRNLAMTPTVASYVVDALGNTYVDGSGNRYVI